MHFSHKNFKRIMLILSPCAALSSFDAQCGSNLQASPQDYKQAMASGKKCVVMIGSDSCPHCKTASKPFENISKKPEYENVEFLKLKSSENPEILDEHKIDGVPAFLYIDNGQVIDTSLGFVSEDDLENAVKKHAHKDAPSQEEVSVEVEDQVSANVEAAAPVQEVPAQEEGILAKIYAFILSIVHAIKDLIIRIFDWIKGLFGK